MCQVLTLPDLLIMGLLGTSGISDSTQGTLISLRPKIVLGASSCSTSWEMQLFTFRAWHTPHTAPPIASTECCFAARVRLGRSLYQLELPLLQFIHGAGTAALGWRLPVGRAVCLVSMVSINLGIWFYGVELGDAGETIEREESQ